MKPILPRLLVAALTATTAHAASSVATWNFGAEESTPLVKHGEIHRDVPGPRPPEFPDFDAGNTAVELKGGGAHFSFADPRDDGRFDFTNGQSITLEAWVNVDPLRPNENLYVVGKGRTGSPDFARDNQNWALRVRESDGQTCVNFLFATKPPSGTAKTDAHWHRWTSRTGFDPGTGWHHIAVSYTFGEPESIRGWIDGQPRPGGWDMGGPTTEPPVVDDDEVWIGSAQGPKSANSFRGSLDAVAIHREILGDDVIRGRFHRLGGPRTTIAAIETMPDLGVLPTGRMLATFHEGFPAHKRWLNEGEVEPAETARWSGREFLLTRLPHRIDAWGIRESWKGPVLTRLAADVDLKPGRRRFVVRARNVSRLWVDGVVVARTKVQEGSTDHDPMTPVAVPPLPGLRPAGYRQQEVFGEIDVAEGGSRRVVFETIVGSKSFRAETGELSVAMETDDGGSFTVLQAAGGEGPPVHLTDADVNAALERIESSLTSLDDQNRRAAASSQDAYWKKRHDAGRDWVADHPAPPSPAGGAHPIDAFLTAKIERAAAESSKGSTAEAAHFQNRVLPILRDECFRCHGDKAKGGLRLNTRAEALKGGDSEQPALVPGDPATSELTARIRSHDQDERMPPKGDGLKSEQIAALETWIRDGAVWPEPPIAPEEITPPPVVDDARFLRRVYLDVVGVPPDVEEARAFLADRSADKRDRLVDRLLDDERWADHRVSYWQEVLAENPSMLKPTLNNTGPFRYYVYEALRDDKPMDRLVTELIMLRGSEREGGSAGFGLAADNDAPFAAKGHVVASAFLGIELQCARCHDSPFHTTLQRDLYSLAALFERKAVTVPKSSTVPAAFFANKGRESLIKVTLKPGESIKPAWPFAETTGCADGPEIDALMQSPDDPRERLAALITAPQNTRFARVMVNRVWRRLIGAGFVEPVQDWEGSEPSHPELLDWLAREFVAHDYDLKHLARLILTSRVYQRAATGWNLKAAPAQRYFAAPERRRLTAEQVVDSLFAASGKPIEVEEITFDPDGRYPATTMISLGFPSRAWMFSSLSNERDRPSLSLPRAQAVADVLEAFGWTGSRQNPRTDRESDPNVLQPGVLANSVVSVWITRASQDSVLANLAVDAASPGALVDSLFLRFLSRPPTDSERVLFVERLAEGFDGRVLPASEVVLPEPPPPLSRVTWSNHLTAEANSIKIEMEHRARAGRPADPRLRSEWREVFEDAVWSLVNDPEFVWVP